MRDRAVCLLLCPLTWSDGMDVNDSTDEATTTRAKESYIIKE